jgi:hypothetical protein
MRVHVSLSVKENYNTPADKRVEKREPTGLISGVEKKTRENAAVHPGIHFGGRAELENGKTEAAVEAGAEKFS